MPLIMPVLFLGHGNPMNALLRNPYSEGWAALGLSLPRPKAILSISAHWYVAGAAVTVNTAPRTIHDFGGFPEELYQVRYPAPGDPVLARRIQNLLAPIAVDLSGEWGLDHGTWSVLCHLFPAADIPVVQVSIDYTRAANYHYEIGRRLAVLREEGVLILGSGNLVHNLRAYRWGKPVVPYPWAVEFDRHARQLLLASDYAPLIAYDKLGAGAALSIPTPDHYLPLLYVLGAAVSGDAISFPIEGIEGGSISMLAVRLESGIVIPSESYS
jgi:4,5-DOPA dioxygenase extradiol